MAAAEVSLSVDGVEHYADEGAISIGTSHRGIAEGKQGVVWRKRYVYVKYWLLKYKFVYQTIHPMFELVGHLK